MPVGRFSKATCLASISVLLGLSACNHPIVTVDTTMFQPTATTVEITKTLTSTTTRIITNSTSAIRFPIPTGTGFPNQGQGDDLVITPGGIAYAGNVQQIGVPNKYPHVATVLVELQHGSSSVSVEYRQNIETVAGEIRNNIVEVYGKTAMITFQHMNLYAVGVPGEMDLTQFGDGKEERPGVPASILCINVPKTTQPGQYSFAIGIEIDGEDYGTVPCTVSVLAPKG